MSNQQNLTVRPKNKLQLTQPTGTLLNNIEASCNTTGVAFLKTQQTPINQLVLDAAFSTVLGLMFTKIANLSGLKGKIEEINKQDISKLILRVYKHLSLNEIYFAFEMERYALYESKTSHFQLFNAEYVADILKKYTNWKRITKIEHSISAPTPTTQHALPAADKNTILNAGVDRLFQEYKTTGIVEKGNVHIYDYLLEIGEIKPATGELRTTLIRQAKINLANEKSTFKKKTDYLQLVKPTATTPAKIAIECKRISLEIYFKTKLTNNTNQ
jgi:hypothetical protein